MQILLLICNMHFKEKYAHAQHQSIAFLLIILLLAILYSNSNFKRALRRNKLTKTANIIMMEQLVQQEIWYFFTRITRKQWNLLTSGSPDCATKILSTELNLTLVLIVTESLFKELNSAKKCIPGENALSLIEDSLLLNLSGALGLPVNNRSLRILTRMIQQIAQENAVLFLKQIKRSDINLEITSPTKLKQIVNQVIKVFIEIGPETPLLPKKHNREDVTKWDMASFTNVSAEDELKTSIQHEHLELLSGITSLLVDVSDYSFKIRSESYLELQSIADRPSTLRYFYSKWFLKVWICRMLQRLKKKYPQDTKAVKMEIIDSIIEGLISAFVDVENQETGNVNSLLIKFAKFPCDNVLELTEKLRDLVFQHALTKQSRESAWKKEFQRKWSDPNPESGIGIDTWRNACVCIVILNWFHNSQADEMVPQIRDVVLCRLQTSAPEHESANSVSSECDEAADWQDFSEVYVKLFVEKAVFHIYSDAKVMERNRDKVIDSLFAKIWPKIKHEKIYITDKTFRSFDGAIHRGLCRRNTIVETMHFMNTLDPVVVDFLISFIRKRLMTPPEEQHPVGRIFSTLGHQLSTLFTSTSFLHWQWSNMCLILQCPPPSRDFS